MNNSVGKGDADNGQIAIKKSMTHEERLQLAEKLDKELDEFIEKLPRKKYEDGWPEDRWEEVPHNVYTHRIVLDHHLFYRKWSDIHSL